MFKNFYNVLLPLEDEDEPEEEKGAEERSSEKKERVLSGCYELNLAYLQEQLCGMRDNISTENRQLYEKLETQLLQLCSKSRVVSK